MRHLVALATFLTMALALAATASAQVVYVPADKVAAVWTKGGPFADKPGMVVHITHRDKAAAVEGHEKTTHIWYITDGGATFITGGTIIGKKEGGRGGNFSGTDLQGGQVHNLKKGDVIIVPAGTPHWWKAVPSSISYYAVNVELASQGSSTK